MKSYINKRLYQPLGGGGGPTTPDPDQPPMSVRRYISPTPGQIPIICWDAFDDTEELSFSTQTPQVLTKIVSRNLSAGSYLIFKY